MRCATSVARAARRGCVALVAGGMLAVPMSSSVQAATADTAADPVGAYRSARDAVLAAPHRSRLSVTATTRVGGVTRTQSYVATTSAASSTRFVAGGFARARLAGDAVRVVGIGSRYYAVAKDGRAYFGPPKALLRFVLSPDGGMHLPDPDGLVSLRVATPVAAGTTRLVGSLSAPARQELVNVLLAEDPTSPLGGRSRITTADVEVTLDAASGGIVGTRVSAAVTVPARQLKGVPSIWITGPPADLTYTVRAATGLSAVGDPVTVVAPKNAVSAHALMYDASAQALLRQGARAMEVLFLGAKTFSTATPARLHAIDATVRFQQGGNGLEAQRRVGFASVNGGYGYELRTTGRTGKVFVYRRDALGQVFTSCRTRASRSCGTW